MSTVQTTLRLPEDVFNETTRAAERAGVSRNEFIAGAIRAKLGKPTKDDELATLRAEVEQLKAART